MPLPEVQTIDSYGGQKVDAYPVVDPTTTVGADNVNAITSDLAMLTRMSPRAIRRFVGGAPPTNPPTGTVHEAMWGHDLADLPVVTRVGPGVYEVTWPTSVTNELGQSTTLNIRWCKAYVESDASFVDPSHAQAVAVAPNKVLVRLYDWSGTPDDLTDSAILVEVY